MQEISAGILIYRFNENNELEVLLGKNGGPYFANRNSNVWNIPKGHVEQGENEEVAALREIYEETSIKAEPTDDFKTEIEYTMPNGKSKTVIYFTASYTNQTPKHNDGFEHNEYMLLEYDAALNSLTFENTKEILIKANEFINNCKD